VAIVHPAAIDGVEPSRRPPVAAIAIVALALLACALERLAGWSLAHHGPLGERAAREIVGAAASARLYAEPELFAPWQPWSATLVAAGWWQALMASGAVLFVGAALEAELGALALASTALALSPLAAAGALLSGGEAGLSGLACALFGMALARWPRARVSWGFSYYAVVEVGHVRLFRTGLADVAALYLSLELLRCVLQGHGSPSGSTAAPWGAWLAGGAAGAAFGLLSRRLRPVLGS
jgi:membrane associated rhomboid family serine protease